MQLYSQKLMLLQSTQKFYGLDHLRTLAILLVFFFHYSIVNNECPDWLISASKFGWTGVDLFFVLSGFLISSQLFVQIKHGEKIFFKTFFLKRFFRIIPAYAVTVAVYFLIPFFREKEALPPFWKFVSFTQNIGLNPYNFGTFSHAWSLCVEEHFYLLLPLVLIVLQQFNFHKKAYWIIILLLVSTIALRFYSYQHLYLPYAAEDNGGIYWYQFIYYPTYTHLDGLLTGVTIAAVYTFLPNLFSKLEKYGNFYVAISVGILALAYCICNNQQSFSASVFGFLLVALGYGFLVLAAICKTSFLYKWKSKTTTFLATISYALYLTHKGIIHVTEQISANKIENDNLLLAISITACIAAAYLLHLLIEKPFMQLRKRWVK